MAELRSLYDIEHVRNGWSQTFELYAWLNGRTPEEEREHGVNCFCWPMDFVMWINEMHQCWMDKVKIVGLCTKEDIEDFTFWLFGLITIE